MRATGMPDWMVRMVALQAASTDGNGHTAAADRLGNAGEPQRQLGDHAERALRADDQPRQVVAGGGLLGAPRGVHHLAVRHHHLQRQHVVLHGAVAHRIGARGAGRGHAAERGVGAGIDREEHALVAQMLVELLAGDARLDDAVEVLGMHREDAVHVAEIDRDAAGRRVDLAFERAAGAERDHRHAMLLRTAARSPARPRSIAETPPRRAAGSRSRWWCGRAARAPPARSRAGCRISLRAHG